MCKLKILGAALTMRSKRPGRLSSIGPVEHMRTLGLLWKAFSMVVVHADAAACLSVSTLKQKGKSVQLGICAS